MVKSFAFAECDYYNRSEFLKKQGIEWVITGNVTLNTNYTINPGDRLVVDDGATLTIPNGITLTNHGGASGDEGIFNYGIITIAIGGTLKSKRRCNNVSKATMDSYSKWHKWSAYTVRYINSP